MRFAETARFPEIGTIQFPVYTLSPANAGLLQPLPILTKIYCQSLLQFSISCRMNFLLFIFLI